MQLEWSAHYPARSMSHFCILFWYPSPLASRLSPHLSPLTSHLSFLPFPSLNYLTYFHSVRSACPEQDRMVGCHFPSCTVSYSLDPPSLSHLLLVLISKITLTCTSEPCTSQPCASQPCASQPCASQPCASQPCASQPCASQP